MALCWTSVTIKVQKNEFPHLSEGLGFGEMVTERPYKTLHAIARCTVIASLQPLKVWIECWGSRCT